MATNKFMNKSVTSATGSSQTLAIANPARREIVISNIAASTWWINPVGGTAAANTTPCIQLLPGQTLVLQNADAITAIGTTSAALTVLER